MARKHIKADLPTVHKKFKRAKHHSFIINNQKAEPEKEGREKKG